MTASKTLHWQDTDTEVHKVVVGPYDNNVFVVRCRATGEAMLIDAANDSGSNAEDAQKSLSTSGKIVQGQAPSLLPGG